MPIAVDTVALEMRGSEHAFQMPLVQLVDRRQGGDASPEWWCFQGHLETVLFHRTEGGRTGAVGKLLDRVGLRETMLQVAKKAVDSGLVTQDEFRSLLATFKLPRLGMCSLESINFTRTCTLVPISSVAALVNAVDEASNPAGHAVLCAIAQHPSAHAANDPADAHEQEEEQEAAASNDAAGAPEEEGADTSAVE